MLVIAIAVAIASLAYAGIEVVSTMDAYSRIR